TRPTGDVARWPTDGDGHPCRRRKRARRREIDRMSAFLGYSIRSLRSCVTCVDSGAGWRDVVGKNDASVHAVDRHRPGVAGDIPIQLVDLTSLARTEEKANCILHTVPDDHSAVRVLRAWTVDVVSALPA